MKSFLLKYFTTIFFAISFCSHAQENSFNLPLGWSMFGYTCYEPVDAIIGFENIYDKVEIVKNELGSAYLPQWTFNGIGNLEFAEGYQIKMLETVEEFTFCTLTSSEYDQNLQQSLDSVNEALNQIEQLFESIAVFGCMDSSACNFLFEANIGDQSCIFSEDFYDCNGICLNDINNNGVCDENENIECSNFGIVNFNIDASQVISATQDNVVINGNFSNWSGWGLTLSDTNGNGIYTGSLIVEEGTYQYVHALTGSSDNWSGWGTVGYAPEDCQDNTNDSFNNYEFTVECGQTLDIPLVCFASCTSCDILIEEEVSSCDESSGRQTNVNVQGRKILIGDEPFHMKGVCWSPHPIGSGPGNNNYFADYVSIDASLMSEAGINVIRTYSPIMDTDILDELLENDIYVLMTVFYGYNDDVDLAVSRVCTLKDHPAIIGWIVGNEWNYNMLGINITLDEAVSIVAEVTSAIKAVDSSRIVSTVYGNIPSPEVYIALPDVDVWGLNVYTGSSFGGIFSSWASLSDKPMYFGEYGCDAYNGLTNSVDENTQSLIVSSLTQEIYNETSLIENGICSGGMLFQFNDEWWKYEGGSYWEHNTESSWTNYSYPDPYMHEEWWGLVDIYRTPRLAYTTYSNMPVPSP